MLTSTSSEFRENIKLYMNRVIDEFETLIVNRSKGKAVVIMSLDEYNAMKSTQHEMSSRVNADRLESALNRAKKGEGQPMELIEP